MRSQRLWVLAVLVGLTGGGCNSPQIPLPPPVIEDLSFELTDASRQLGRMRGSGEHTPEMGDATVRVINLRDRHGVITPAAADGSFETRPFEMRDGDQLRVDYNIETEVSDALCTVVSYDQGLSLCPADDR